MKILITGGTGLIGRNVIPILEKKYRIYSPSRKELDLLDFKAVERYIKTNNFDVVFHCANPNQAHNPVDSDDEMLNKSLRCFMNLYRVRRYCKKLFYIGSGAEFDKKYDMCKIKERDFDRSIPQNDYGFAKYIMNYLAKESENVYNLRVFACFGPGDTSNKFITHCIRSVLINQDITIRQNCVFDYLHVYDLANIFSYFIENNPLYHDYNIGTGISYTLEDIAKKVLIKMNSDKKIIILKPGMNKEYTPDISRLKAEIGNYNFITLNDGIDMQIKSELKRMEYYIKNK